MAIFIPPQGEGSNHRIRWARSNSSFQGEFLEGNRTYIFIDEASSPCESHSRCRNFVPEGRRENSPCSRRGDGTLGKLRERSSRPVGVRRILPWFNSAFMRWPG